MEYLQDGDDFADIGLSLVNRDPTTPEPVGVAQRPSEAMFSTSSFQEEETGDLLSDIYKLQNFDSDAPSAGRVFDHDGSALSEELLPRRCEVEVSLLKSDSLSECTESVEMNYGSAVCPDQSRTPPAKDDDLSSFLIMPPSPDPTLLSVPMANNEGDSMLLQDVSSCSREVSIENAKPKSFKADHPDAQDQQNAVSQSITNGAIGAVAKANPFHSIGIEVHSDNAALLQAPVRGPDGLYSCSFCKMRFKQTGNRKKHIEETHMRRKPFSCSICLVSFSRKHARDTHQKAVHEQLRPYSCPFCFKLYKNRSDLNKHIRTVEKREKPFSCETCGRSFGERGKLRRHTAIHTKAIKFQVQEQRQPRAP